MTAIATAPEPPAETVIGTLSALDLKALQQADIISFSHSENKGAIICRKKVPRPGPFDDEERAYEIKCDSVITDSYNHLHPEQKYQYGWAQTYHYCDYWHTIHNLLKVGDILSLDWHADGHTNGYMEKHDLHGDYLVLVVYRKGRVLKFVIGTSCCEANTARMVRVGRWG
jgi:hypothetical protein